MVQRDIVFVNGSSVRLKFSYRYGVTASKREDLETLGPDSSFTYKVQDNGTHEKIEVDYVISSEGSEQFEPTNLIINADTMSKYSTIKVVDCRDSSDDAGTSRKFRLDTVARAPTPGVGWISSSVEWFRALVRNAVPARDPAQDIPR